MRGASSPVPLIMVNWLPFLQAPRKGARRHRTAVGLGLSAAQHPPLPGAFRLLGAAPTPCLTRLAQQFSYLNAVVTGTESRDR